MPWMELHALPAIMHDELRTRLPHELSHSSERHPEGQQCVVAQDLVFVLCAHAVLLWLLRAALVLFVDKGA